MKWIELEIVTSSEAMDAVSGILLDFGISGVSIQDPHDLENFKEEFPFWDYIDEKIGKEKKEDVIIKAYIPYSENFKEIVEELKIRILKLKQFDLDIGKGQVFVNSLNQEDWEESWKEYFKTFRSTDKIVINPLWRKYVAKQDEIVIDMDPGMAFGTGEHETTSMCLELLEKSIKKEDDVLDIGCGSGILSIAAKKLGANIVEAIDLDPIAVKVAKENISYNNLEGKITVKQGNLIDETNGKYDIIVANIMADIIVILVQTVHQFMKKDALFIASGIIVDKLDEVILELKKNNFVVVTLLQKGEWNAIVARQGE